MTLSGELDLAFGISPALVVKDVTFANASWGSLPQMVEIERLQAQIRLLPLLFKDLEIVQIGLSGVKVLLETGADARNNWDFLAKRKSANSAGAFMPPEIGVDQVSIKNLQLTFHRHQTVSKTQFTLSSLSMSRQEDENDLTLKLHADYNGQPVALKGTIGSIHQLLKHERFPVQLSGKFSNAAFIIDGAVDDILNLKDIDLKAHASGTDLAALRLHADLENTKKRLTRSSAQEVAAQKEALLRDLLPVADGLDLALMHRPDKKDDRGVLQGIEMVRDMLNKFFNKHDVKAIDAWGKPFDPRLHEAIGVLSHPKFPPYTVVKVEQKGYLYGDKLLRPAQVVVTPQ